MFLNLERINSSSKLPAASSSCMIRCDPISSTGRSGSLKTTLLPIFHLSGKYPRIRQTVQHNIQPLYINFRGTCPVSVPFLASKCQVQRGGRPHRPRGHAWRVSVALPSIPSGCREDSKFSVSSQLLVCLLFFRASNGSGVLYLPTLSIYMKPDGSVAPSLLRSLHRE